MPATDEQFLEKLREAFKIEADEHLQAMSSGFLELEKNPRPERCKEIVEVVFREAHSLKGAARAVNRSDIESVCQVLESVFAKWKQRGPDTAAATFDVLNRAVDLLTRLVARADGGVEQNQVPSML